jgi:hypothetical protein
MRAPYFAEALQFPEIDHGAIPEPTITEETMEAIGRALDRMNGRAAAERQGFEPAEYTERS